MCSFAIDMVRAASTVISPLDGEALQIRCGLHSGAVMSGVVGDVRPRYCKQPVVQNAKQMLIQSLCRPVR